MSIFFSLLWFFTFIVFWVFVVLLIIDVARDKPAKKRVVALVVCFAIGFVCLVGLSFTSCQHEYEIVSEVAATCTVDGEIVSVCIECGNEDVEVIPALGHRMEVVSETAPTYNSVGLLTEVCSVCGFECETETDNADFIKEYEEEQAQIAIVEAELERISVTYAEIYEEYQSNELRADEAYKGNRYYVSASVRSIDPDSILNWGRGTTLTLRTTVNGDSVTLFACFNEDEEESLKGINTGDTITFEGQCSSDSLWMECVLVED